MSEDNPIDTVHMEIQNPRNVIPQEIQETFIKLYRQVYIHMDNTNDMYRKAATCISMTNTLLDIADTISIIEPVKNIGYYKNYLYVGDRENVLTQLTRSVTIHPLVRQVNSIQSEDLYSTFINAFEKYEINSNLNTLSGVYTAITKTRSTKMETKVLHRALQVRFAKLCNQLEEEQYADNRSKLYKYIKLQLETPSASAIKTLVLRCLRLFEVCEVLGEGIIFVEQNQVLRSALDMKSQEWDNFVLSDHPITMINVPTYQTDILNILDV